MKNYQIFSAELNGDHSPLQVDFSSNNICHRCGIGVEKLISDSFYILSSSHYYVYMIECCPVCHHAALQEYVVSTQVPYGNSLDLRKYSPRIFPHDADQHIFPEKIQALSPAFVDLYHQSEMAEQNGSADICGMGYRKAVEFLIKDFLIHLSPEQQDKIANMLLSPTIDLLENTRLKTIAKRCAWLGNDESHYVRKHEDYSVADLKIFILACVSYIDSELCVEQAEAITPVRS